MFKFTIRLFPGTGCPQLCEKGPIYPYYNRPMDTRWVILSVSRSMPPVSEFFFFSLQPLEVGCSCELKSTVFFQFRPAAHWTHDTAMAYLWVRQSCKPTSLTASPTYNKYQHIFWEVNNPGVTQTTPHMNLCLFNNVRLQAHNRGAKGGFVCNENTEGLQMKIVTELQWDFVTESVRKTSQLQNNSIYIHRRFGWRSLCMASKNGLSTVERVRKLWQSIERKIARKNEEPT